ncbi:MULTISPECIES: adenosine deaminase family protein [unclassified Leptolyngbya]|nr:MULTISPECIES: adenosine deaminase family protein [unclassified Leptolyngbya]
MPKAELHLHLEGAPRWASVREAHQRHYGAELPELPPWYAPNFRFTHFGEFQSLFQRYIHPWLQTPLGYAEIIHDVVDSLVEQNIRYAEINVAASLVERHGASLEQVWEILETEIKRAIAQGCVIRIFVGLMRNHGVEEAIAWVRKTRLIAIVSGFDLQGDEVGWPANKFKPAFDLAREAGKRIKVHAGEMTGPESIRIAVEELEIHQIGHGTSAIHDPEVMALLRDRQVTVEMCPTSNERLGYISSYSAHPIFALDAAGIAVTVNSDDPTFFGYTLTDELSRLIKERQASLVDLKRWTRNAFSQAILDEPTRRRFIAELENWSL